MKIDNISMENREVNSSRTHWNLSSQELQKTLIQSKQAIETSTGALIINTGKFTGRSPKDKFIVKDSLTKDSVSWGGFNNPFESDRFENLHKKILDYIDGKDLYIRDVYACADSRYRLKIRAITEQAWSNLFVHNMFFAPTKEDLASFEAEWTIYCVPSFKADPKIDKTRSENFSIIDFTKKVLLIGGSGFTGEMKKGIFTVLNFILPHQQDVLSMHCSANIGKKGDTALFFGLSGTGKTTLSADPNRKLIGDDEHGWAPDHTIFNFEGGCYAKTINITKEKEPDIFNAIKTGALLENVVCKKGTNEVDYMDSSKTENTRVSYPIHHISRIAIPSIGEKPKNIFFLTCDAHGVFPPISKLTPGQAAFYFISGYTAKIPGTEADIDEPKTTFSTCFGAPFLPLYPTKYAEMFIAKMKQVNSNAWLVNTGWSGGEYGTGQRMNLKHTRALLKAALDGSLDRVSYVQHDVFGLAMPTSCLGVPSEMLNPKNMWEDKGAYDRKTTELALSFNKNFEKFLRFADKDILAGAPMIK